MTSPGFPVTERVQVIDSHTAGEPTRVVISGGPNLGTGSLKEKLERFRSTADDFRRQVILEPRGSDAHVGALLCEPTDPTCASGVIFFNNTGYLGMCGHGAMGVAVTLAHLGRIGLGLHRLDTPVGAVEVNLIESNRVAIQNVDSECTHRDVTLEVEGLGLVTGDIAWGGNWFFLVQQTPVPLTRTNLPQLTDAAQKVRDALIRNQITGTNGEEIDHIEFFGPAHSPKADSRNFVYCPGGAYDRSPCGTGTSAKLACLAARGKLQPGKNWIQESIIGSQFVASYQPNADGTITPTIMGSAYVCAESVLIHHPQDPFRHGIDSALDAVTV